MNLAYKKILGKFTKVLGFGKTPPPHVGKNSQIISFFFSENVPYFHSFFRYNIDSSDYEIKELIFDQKNWLQ